MRESCSQTKDAVHVGRGSPFIVVAAAAYRILEFFEMETCSTTVSIRALAVYVQEESLHVGVVGSGIMVYI